MDDNNRTINYSTYFDSLVSDVNLQMLKVILPFLPIKTQKLLSIIIKITELKNTIILLNSPQIRTTGIHINGTGNNLNDMLDAMKQFLSPSDIEIMDIFMTIMELGKMSGDEQNEMLNNYMEMFSGISQNN